MSSLQNSQTNKIINKSKLLINPKTCLAFILLLFSLHVFHFNFVCDDAFISFRYAKNFINDYGLVWNINEKPVEGYTNFLWVMVISLLMKTGVEPIIPSKVLGLFFGFCSVLLSYLFSELIFERKSHTNLLAPLILAFCGPFAAWSSGGLETQMFTFLVLAAVSTYLYEIQNDIRFPSSSVLFAFASLVRPEGVFLFLITAAYHFFYSQWFKNNSFRKYCFWLIPFIIMYGIYSYWRFYYFGYIFPNTYYAKTGGGIHQILRGLNYFSGFFLYTIWPVLALIVLPFCREVRTSVLYLLLLILSYLGYVILIGGDFLGMFRFFVPLLPLMAITAQEGFIALVQVIFKLISHPFMKKVAATICLLALIFLIAKSARLSFDSDESRLIRFHQIVVNDQTAVGKWLRKNALPHESIAVIAIGAISYYSELTSIDRLGLTDSYIAHTEMEHMGKGLAGHEKRNFGYILSRKPTYFFGPLAVPLHTQYTPTRRERRVFQQLYKPIKMGLKLQLKTAGIAYKLKENYTSRR